MTDEDGFARTNAEIDVLRKEARARAVQLKKLNEALDAARRAAPRVWNGHGAKPTAENPFTDEVLIALARGLVPFIHDVITEAVAPRDKRIAELEATSLSDGGTWKPEKLFRPNQLVTFDGAPWLCREENSNVRPGTSNHWRLIGKTKGR